jgi:hypothetical protein
MHGRLGFALLLCGLSANCTIGGRSPQIKNGKTDAGADAGGPTTDSGTAPVVFTFSQTSGLGGNQPAYACLTPDGLEQVDNSYYRVFGLGDAFIRSDFVIKSVTFPVTYATSPTGSQEVLIRIYTGSFSNGGIQLLDIPSFTLASLILVSSAQVAVPNTQIGEMVTASFDTTITKGGVFVAEVFTPSGAMSGNNIRIGTNNDPQSRHPYFRAPVCGVNDPTNFSNINQPNMALVMEVTGEYIPM